MRLVLVLALLLLCGCPLVLPPWNIICTTQFVYGLTVAVMDEQDEPVAGAVLTLRDGAYTEQMTEREPGLYIGAGERPGVYTLTVEALGFASSTVENIVITADLCHVIPVGRQVTLARN